MPEPYFLGLSHHSTMSGLSVVSVCAWSVLTLLWHPLQRVLIPHHFWVHEFIILEICYIHFPGVFPELVPWISIWSCIDGSILHSLFVQLNLGFPVIGRISRVNAPSLFLANSCHPASELFLAETQSQLQSKLSIHPSADFILPGTFSTLPPTTLLPAMLDLWGLWRARHIFPLLPCSWPWMLVYIPCRNGLMLWCVPILSTEWFWSLYAPI